MAKSTKEVKEKAIEVTLWEAANKLRGSVLDNPVAIDRNIQIVAGISLFSSVSLSK